MTAAGRRRRRSYDNDADLEPLRALRPLYGPGSMGVLSPEERHRRWLLRDANDLFKQEFSWIGRSDAVRVIQHNGGWSVALLLDGIYARRIDAEEVAAMHREDIPLILRNAERATSPLYGTPVPMRREEGR